MSKRLQYRHRKEQRVSSNVSPANMFILMSHQSVGKVLYQFTYICLSSVQQHLARCYHTGSDSASVIRKHYTVLIRLSVRQQAGNYDALQSGAT